MAAINFFYPTGFSLAELTASINSIPFLPSQLGDSGLFEYASVASTTVFVEKRQTQLTLFQTAPRGAPGQQIGRSLRDVRPFLIPHIPFEDMVLADEVQNLRQFGTEDQPTPVQLRLREVMELAMQKLQYTLEFHRVGALKGLVLDADGSTLWNLYNEFGVTQQTLNFGLGDSATDVRSKCDTVRNMLDDTLLGTTYTGVQAWVGRNFWQKLTNHKAVRETYLNWTNAAELRGLPTDNKFVFGDITFNKYRGRVGATLTQDGNVSSTGTPMIGDDECYLVPEGVPGLFIGRFGPGTYIDAVNMPGQMIYMQGIQRNDNTGWHITGQSNPLHLCTRPRAIIKGTVA
jgi:hypothetical protein